MIITGLHNNAIRLLRRLDIDPNKFDINSNLVLSFWQKKHSKQYAFITDQYCKICIYYYNKFESTTNNEYIIKHINDFAHHVLFNHFYKSI